MADYGWQLVKSKNRRGGGRSRDSILPDQTISRSVLASVKLCLTSHLIFLPRTSSLTNIFSESEFPSLPKPTAKKRTIPMKSPPGKKLKEDEPSNEVSLRVDFSLIIFYLFRSPRTV